MKGCDGDPRADAAVLARSPPGPQDTLRDEIAVLRAENRRLRERLAHIEADPAPLLAREADHRVKNSLQMLVSMMRLQAERQADPELRAQLRQAGDRIQAISMTHGLLQRRHGGGTVDFDDLARELCASLAAGFGARDGMRSVAVACDAAPMRPEAARALALVLCELVANALRHAAPGEAPCRVEVTGRRTAEGAFRLTVADDGRGLGHGFDPRRASGLGLRLVGMMAGQLGATLAVEDKGGARFTVTVPAARL